MVGLGLIGKALKDTSLYSVPTVITEVCCMFQVTPAGLTGSHLKHTLQILEKYTSGNHGICSGMMISASLFSCLILFYYDIIFSFFNIKYE